MTAEKGICPRTREVCADRLACERSLEEIRKGKKKLERMQRLPFSRLIDRLNELVGLESAAGSIRKVEEVERGFEVYLELSCVKESCIIREAIDKDTSEGRGPLSVIEKI